MCVHVSHNQNIGCVGGWVGGKVAVITDNIIGRHMVINMKLNMVLKVVISGTNHCFSCAQDSWQL